MESSFGPKNQPERQHKKQWQSQNGSGKLEMLVIHIRTDFILNKPDLSKMNPKKTVCYFGRIDKTLPFF